MHSRFRSAAGMQPADTDLNRFGGERCLQKRFCGLGWVGLGLACGFGLEWVVGLGVGWIRVGLGGWIGVEGWAGQGWVCRQVWPDVSGGLEPQCKGIIIQSHKLHGMLVVAGSARCRSSLRLRTHQRALVGSFPSMCENWLGSNVWSPTRLRRLLQRPIWIHACVSSSCRCGIGSNPRTHSRHDTEQCHANHDEPEAHCPEGNAPPSPATLGFGTSRRLLQWCSGAGNCTVGG